MKPPPIAHGNRDDREIADTVQRERSRLGNFIRGQVRNQTDAEDILQDVFQEFVEAYRLPAPIEQATAWLYRVARNRIIDRFRKRREHLASDLAESAGSDHFDAEGDYRLELQLPSPDAGPEASYMRSLLLEALQQAVGELPEAQRAVFIAHELEGVSFKTMAAQRGQSINTLLAQKRYAILHLRERLQTIYDELEL